MTLKLLCFKSILTLMALSLSGLVAAQENSSAGLEGVWIDAGKSIADIGLRGQEWPEEPPFTSDGAAEFESTNIADDPVVARCWPAGPVRMMDGKAGRIIEIIESPDSFTIIPNDHYLARRIYIDNRDFPSEDEWIPSFNGYSIGVQRDESLVVETRHLNGDIWLSDQGLPTSFSLSVRESFRLVGNGEYLEITSTIEDPEYYSETVVVRNYWRRANDIDVGEPDYSCREHLKLLEF